MLPLLVIVETRSGGRYHQLEQYDSLRIARCTASCWSNPPTHKEGCVDTCLSADFNKPGQCPNISTLSVFDAACINACHNDPECSGTDKCCTHSCGITCQHAQGLDIFPGLPPIPSNVTITERRRGRTVLVEWVGAPIQEEPVLYILEERHHVGLHFTPARLSNWVPRHRSVRTNVTLKNSLHPGHWYQFRVAAVNANGTRGFSKQSEPFTLSIVPKAPGPPLKLAVGSLMRVNGTLWGVLRWEPPVSDLPIQRYKVFWSRRLQGAASSLISVLVNHQTVPRDVLKFSLKHLEPESLYFLQVQALSQFGRERLKGEKAAIFLNTADHKNVTEVNIGSHEGNGKRSAGRVEELKVQRVFWHRGQLMARITWLPRPVMKEASSPKYTVAWWSGHCHNQTNTHQPRMQLAATTEIAQYDLYDLSFSCKYRVTVRESHPEGSNSHHHEATLMFMTPTCHEFAVSSSNTDQLHCSQHENTT